MLLATLAVLPLAGQNKAAIATATVKGPLAAKRGTKIVAPVQVKLRTGYHVNSNTPSDKYLIPLKLTWDRGALQTGESQYPKPVLRKYPFSEQKLSVFEGDFAIEQEFTVPANAMQGFGAMTGKLRYQACTESECYPPATAPVRVSYDIR